MGWPGGSRPLPQPSSRTCTRRSSFFTSRLCWRSWYSRPMTSASQAKLPLCRRIARPLSAGLQELRGVGGGIGEQDEGQVGGQFPELLQAGGQVDEWRLGGAEQDIRRAGGDHLLEPVGPRAMPAPGLQAHLPQAGDDALGFVFLGGEDQEFWRHGAYSMAMRRIRRVGTGDYPYSGPARPAWDHRDAPVQAGRRRCPPRKGARAA